MKKLMMIIPLFLLMFLTFSCSKEEEFSEEKLNKNLNNYIASLVDDTKDYIPSWNKENFKGKWNYIDGVFLNSLIESYMIEKDKKTLDFILKYTDYYINSNGEFVNLLDSEKSGFTEGELDTICESKILFDLYAFTNDSKYLKAIEYTYEKLTQITRAKNGINFSHKESYPYQIWLDGMYMYVPFYARYGLLHKNDEIFTEIVAQYEYIRQNMFDENSKLYYHGNDTSKSIFWANKETGNSKSFWLRSMGWYIMSLVDVIEYFNDSENKEYLISLLDEALDGIIKYIDDDTKMFYQLIDKKNQSFLVPALYLSGLKNTKYQSNGKYNDTTISNYLESSGSSMIAYSLMKASRLGYIEDKFELGKEIFFGTFKHSYKNNSLNDICITAGLGPENKIYRDGTSEYYLAEPVGENDAKGVGPFLMAYLEYKNNKDLQK